MTTDEQAINRPRPDVSVVVPSYNHEAFIEMTLRSIIKQTLTPAELIVIDDGSTDNSRSIIDRVLKQSPFRCEVIARGNRGLCATLNEGLERSTGEYFAYLGSDDLWLPDFLEARTELLSSRPMALLAYGHAFFIDEENRIVDCTRHWANYADGDACHMLLQTIAPMSPTVLYRREVLLRHRWNEKARLEDYELYLRLCAEGEFAFDERVLSAWRRHGSNTSWDQRMMLDEQLKAQRDAAHKFGLNESEIEKLQTATKFQRAEDFLRVGDKAQALKLMSQNVKGIKSLGTLARMLARIVIPFSLIERRTRSRGRRSNELYGSIEI
jgi:alpha-1,3-rhamnosyltransferase